MISLTKTAPKSLAQLAELCGGEVVGNADYPLVGVCSVENPVANQLTFVGSDNLLKHVDTAADCAYVIKPEYRHHIENGIIHDNPTQAFRLILAGLMPLSTPSVAASARIANTAVIGDNVSIGDNVIIAEHVVIGDNCHIAANSVIGEKTQIGADTHVGYHVVIHHRCHVGQGCVIADGAVIGGQGFGFSFEGGQWHAIAQVGSVRIGDHVHIGANTCIDRGAIEDTVIGNNVIIDNLVHIAHNVKVGDGTAMAACVGIAGSTTIGKYCLLAGQVGVAGHLSICDGVQVNGGARVLQSIKKPGVYGGSFTALPVNQWNRITVYVKKLESLFRREK